ncbi:unnamed protein product, partial [Ectocarpus sp. 6 AP-2014]
QIPRTRWSVLAVLAVFVKTAVAAGCENFEGTAGTNTNGDVQVCCASETCRSACDQANCSIHEDDDSCCPDTIANSETVCGVDGGAAPCTLGCENDYEGITGTNTNGDVQVCCANSCGNTCDQDNCSAYGDDDSCCPDTIAESDTECGADGGAAPCILYDSTEGDDDTPAPTPAETESTEAEPSQEADDDDSKSAETPAPALAELMSTSDSDGTSSAVIALSVLLAAFVLGNIACFAWCLMRRRKEPPTPPPAGRRDANTEVELGRLRRDLDTERTRRVKAETLVHRAKGGGLRSGDFPSVRDVYQHVYQLADDALAWTEKACAVGGSHPALNGTVLSVLYNTFLVCREEVQRCLDERLQNLSAFLGNDEPILLSAGDEMNLDTQYVLYECLCKDYQRIVPADPDRMDALAGVVLERCGQPADRSLANEIVSGATWPSFEALMKNYLLVFVEMALQKPRVEFEDNLGDAMTFDSIVHRDWAPYSKAPAGQSCSIVFPAIRPQEGRPTSNAKIGVVRLPA